MAKKQTRIVLPRHAHISASVYNAVRLDGVVKNPIYCVAALFYSFKHTTCMAFLSKKRYALVIEFFDPSNMNWAIQYLLRVYQTWMNWPEK
jgi:hypothetical protein